MQIGDDARMRSILAGLFLAMLSVLSSCVSWMEGPRNTHIANVAYRVTVDCNGDGQVDILGSATAIGRRTFITARHVVECPPTTGIFGQFGFNVSPPQFAVIGAFEEKPQAVLVELLSARADVALVRLPDDAKDNPVWAQFSRSEHVGEEVYMYAGGNSIEFVWKVGYLSGQDKEHVWVSVHGVPGNSGGGIFNSRGYLIGVISLGRWEVQREFRLWAIRPEMFDTIGPGR